LWATAEIELGRLDVASSLLDRVDDDGIAAVLRVAALRARTSEDPVQALIRVAQRAQEHGAAAVQAEAWADLSMIHHSRGDLEQMRKTAGRAVELWDEMATSLPPAHRANFWRDTRRQRTRDASRRQKSSASAPLLMTAAPLLANLRRLAGERDPSKLLEVITDGAVALSGAERGFVLLVDENGALEARTIRSAQSQLGEAAAAFSRSIAETVLIDGEPIVTVDAAHDPRVRDYLSVHRLMLKSVACLPIESRGRTWGVLYLEHRSAGGHFSGADLALLRAYADQAAIAVETSDLLERIEAQKRDLERANGALREANEHLEQQLQGQAEVLKRTKREISRLHGLASRGERWGLVGASEGMRRVYEVLDRVCASDVPVVITGESGTGKELIARAIHRGGARADAPYISISCGAIPYDLLESELFGHVAGAFTGAVRAREGLFVQAHGGTLFMDEIEDMPPRMQLDLLRVLQEGRVRPVGATDERQVDVRIVTACKRPLRELIEEGKLREDLYYRLAVVEVRLPPLRERGTDIPLLCDHFLGRIAQERGEPRKRLSREALQRLCTHDFPGNVRELEHLLINAAVFADGEVIGADDLSFGNGGRAKSDPGAGNYRNFKNAERERIVAALNAHGWNRARAARALGMARRTFYRRLEEHRIELPKGRD
jgi:transcriptional regulator with GAF, ATPase, and Fis domain